LNFKFANALQGWSKEKMVHYYNACIEYSGSKGEMYCDWILAVKSWDRRTPYKEQNGDTKISKLESTLNQRGISF